eukprot:c26969_g1_i1 orf=178-1515(-)
MDPSPVKVESERFDVADACPTDITAHRRARIPALFGIQLEMIPITYIILSSTKWRNGFSDMSRAFFLVVLLTGFLSPAASTSSLGINYGMIANNLPSPSEVARLIQSISVSKSKLYNSDPDVLLAFENTGISFIIGIGNEDIPSLTDPINARNWVKQYIGFFPNTKITGVTVGNEIFGSGNTLLMSQLLPAMQNLQSAIVDMGLSGRVAISTPHSLAVLSTSFPPSAGAFLPDLVNPYIKPVLQFLSETGSPFMINIYPFFAYKSDPQGVSLDYALFQPNVGVIDPNSGLKYYNMFDAQLDAVYSALKAVGYGNLQVMVSETGWPSAGDSDEAGATIENAQMYNVNLIQHLASNKGTPLRPNQHIEAYIFALFNENLKPGPTSERNYGLFHPDGTRVYNFGLSRMSSELMLSSDSLKSHSLELSSFLKILFLCLYILIFELIILS